MKTVTFLIYFGAILLGPVILYPSVVSIPDVNDSLLELSGLQCPQEISFTCNALEFNSPRISWFAGDIVLATYRYFDGNRFPFEVVTESSINATSQISYSNFSTSFNYVNFTLSVNLSELVLFQGENITCGTTSMRSESIHVGNFEILEFELEVNLTGLFSKEKLVSIVAEWTNVLANCEIMSKTLTIIEVKDEKNTSLVTTTSSCVTNSCVEVISVNNFNSSIYTVEITSEGKSLSKSISGFHKPYLDYSKIMNDCMINISCYAMVNETCNISVFPGSSTAMMTNRESSYIILNAKEISSYTVEFNATSLDVKISLRIYFSNGMNERQFRSLVGIAIAFYVIGILVQCAGYTIGIIIWKLDCVRNKYLKKITLIYSVLPVVIAITTLVLWISYGSLSTRCQTMSVSKDHLLFAAAAFSFIVLLVSIVTLGGFIIVIGKKDNKYHQNMEFEFHFYIATSKSRTADKKCATCQVAVKRLAFHHYCVNCGKRLCSNCSDNKKYEVVVWRKMGFKTVCEPCHKEYCQENKQFSQERTVCEISDYLKSNNLQFCDDCKKNKAITDTPENTKREVNEVQETTLCDTCSHAICETKSNGCYNQKCEKVKEKNWCVLCYILHERQQHQERNLLDEKKD